jgi:hypothetical protein
MIMRRSRWIRAVAGLVGAMTAGAIVPAPGYAIAGGEAVADGSYEFVAKVQNDVASCTAVLVDPLWVLTARACLTSNGQPEHGVPTRQTTVTVGRTNLAGTTGQVRDAVEVVPHPDRNASLVRLSAPVADIAPIPLATTAAVAGEVLRVAGYGRTATEWVPDRLHSGRFTVQSVGATTAGVLGLNGASICKGDAGGPAFRELEGRVELVGINNTSWQAGCLDVTETRQGATETRVDDLSEWIVTNTGSCWTQTEAGFTPLYDGRSPQTQSWRTLGSVTVTEDRCQLSVTGTGVRWYGGEHTTPSYTLRLDWKARSAQADSGVLVGFPMPDNDPAVPETRGVEVQIKPGEAGATGALVGLRDPDVTTAARPLGQWNSYEIAVDGRHVSVRLNDVLVNEVTLTDLNRMVSAAYIGLAAGTAEAPVEYRNIRIKMGPRPQELGQLGDFDGDGKPDLAGYGFGGDLWVHPNASTPGTMATTNKAWHVSNGWGNVRPTMTADVDRDGKSDVLGLDGSNWTVWRSTSTSTQYSFAWNNLGSGWNVFTRWVPPADFDGDGRPDVAAVATDDLWIHRNTSTPGTIVDGGGYRVGPGWGSLTNFITGDFDADGRADIASLVNGSKLWVWRSTSTATAFSFATMIEIDLKRTAQYVSIADFDGDGRVDIICHSGGELWVYRSTSVPGTIGQFSGQFVSGGWASVSRIMVSDFDGDGRADILGCLNSGDELAVWRSTATASTASVATLVSFGAGWNTFSRFLTATPAG